MLPARPETRGSLETKNSIKHTTGKKKKSNEIIPNDTLLYF